MAIIKKVKTGDWVADEQNKIHRVVLTLSVSVLFDGYQVPYPRHHIKEVFDTKEEAMLWKLKI